VDHEVHILGALGSLVQMVIGPPACRAAGSFDLVEHQPDDLQLGVRLVDVFVIVVHDLEDLLEIAVGGLEIPLDLECAGQGGDPTRDFTSAALT
jgi:hypothetical protein